MRACKLAFVGKEVTLTLGNDTDGGIVDIYADQNFWGSIDAYAASSGDETVTIEFYRDTAHVPGTTKPGGSQFRFIWA